MNDRDLCLEVV